MNRSSNLSLLVLALCLSLSACQGKSPTSPAAAAEGKVAVKINGEPISVAELDNGNSNPHGAPMMNISGARLKIIVNTELLRQAAVKAKLDQEPDIRARIANATRMILSSAYMDKKLSSLGQPSEADVNEYYKQHPERYAKGKEYALQEFSIQAPAEKTAEIQAELGKLKKPEKFDKWLTKNKIPHQKNRISAASNQLPDRIMQKLKDLPVGGYFVMDNKNGPLNIVFVLSEQPHHMTLAKSELQITTRLIMKRKKDTIDNLMKQLHDQAKIEYIPPYTKNGLTPSANGG